MQIYLIYRFNIYCPSFIFKTTEQNAKNIYFLYHGYQFDDKGRQEALKLLLMPQHKLNTEGVTSLIKLSMKFKLLMKYNCKECLKRRSFLLKQTHNKEFTL